MEARYRNQWACVHRRQASATLALLPKTSQKARPASWFAGVAGREPERSVLGYVSTGSGARPSLRARSWGVATGRKFPAVVLALALGLTHEHATFVTGERASGLELFSEQRAGAVNPNLH